MFAIFPSLSDDFEMILRRGQNLKLCGTDHVFAVADVPLAHDDHAALMTDLRERV